MKKLLFLAFLSIGLSSAGCKGDGADETFSLQAKILNPAGNPQGGAVMVLKGKSDIDPIYSGISDTAGIVNLRSPSGSHIFQVKLGSVFLVEVTINVLADDSGTVVQLPITLEQNPNLKVLVVKAGCEQLEDVLRDPKVGFTQFDETTIDSMVMRCDADSNAALNYLKQYTIVFSDCNCGSEGGSSYALLSRMYGKYVTTGGKMYGGHYNYYHLQRIFPTFYTQTTGVSNDSIQVVDANLSTYTGISISPWIGTVGYTKFTDLPAGAKIYIKIFGATPDVPVLMENYLGTGKFAYTVYHNQDVINDAVLIKIVQYFLYTL